MAQFGTIGEDRCSYDPDEEFPWDCDLQTASESEVHDLLSEEDDDE